MKNEKLISKIEWLLKKGSLSKGTSEHKWLF
jgi:hypothetical protein